MSEKTIRGWRVRAEGPGFFVWFDPSIEHVKVFEGGMDLAYEIRERREAGEDGDVCGQLEMDGLAESEISS